MNGRIASISRLFGPLVILLALLFAAEPILHTHPLDAGSPGSTCAICATGESQLASTAPTIAAPTVVSYALESIPAPAILPAAAITLPSRAPPTEN